jgi:hypothetical protein
MNHRNPLSLAAYLSTIALAAVVVAGCGQAFSLTGGTSGGGGNGGDGATTTSSTGNGTASTSGTGATTSSSSTATSSGTGGLTGCNWGPGAANPCGANAYCDDPTCGATLGAGKCKLKTVGSTGDAPVCGCDGLTYWNGLTAASRGMATQHNVACPGAIDIGCSDANPCPNGNSIYCRKFDKSCMISFQGACWVLPADCGSTASKVETCLTKNCVNECDAIKQGNVFDQPCGG